MDWITSLGSIISFIRLRLVQLYHLFASDAKSSIHAGRKNLHRSFPKMLYSTNPKPENVGELLREPTAEASEIEFIRAECDFTDKSERFHLKGRNFNRQYAHLYSERLLTMRTKLAKASKSKWG